MTRQDILNLIENAPTSEPESILSALEDAGLLWTPENNTTPWYLLTPEQQASLKAAKHGWKGTRTSRWFPSSQEPKWFPDYIYRAKPAPLTVSTWTNAYSGGAGISHLGSPYTTRKEADACAGSNSTHVIRLDLTDGFLTTTTEEI